MLIHWYDILLATLGAVSMIAVPLTIWLCLYCSERKLKQTEATEEAHAIVELEKGWQNEQTTHRVQHPEPVDTDLPPSYELDSINYKWSSRISQLKKNSVKRKGRREAVSCSRVFSATWYISSWIWAFFIAIYIPVTMPIDKLFALFIVAAISLSIGVIFVCFESIWARERRYLSNLESADGIDARLRTLRNTPPVITFHAVAYHYETRTRTVWYTDSQGHSQTRIETYEETVVTGRFEEVFAYHNWTDESETTVMDDISPHQVTRIAMELVIKFEDDQSQAAFNQQYDLFKLNHRDRDVHVDFREERTVAGFKSHLAAYTDLNEKPWWIRQRYYCMASIMFLTWPYRIMFKRATAKISYSLVKSIKCEIVPPGSVLTMPLSLFTPNQPGATPVEAYNIV